MPSKEAMEVARLCVQLHEHRISFPVDLAEAFATALDTFAAEAVQREREACAGVADRYAEKPLGDARNDTMGAHAAGMTYTTGGSDTASAVAAAIRARKDQP